jgi:hypothetical protein
MEISTVVHDLPFAFRLALIRLTVAAEYTHYKEQVYRPSKESNKMSE